MNLAHPELKRGALCLRNTEPTSSSARPAAAKEPRAGRWERSRASFIARAGTSSARSILAPRLARHFSNISSKGQLVPDEITVELWRVSIQLCVDSHQFKPDIDYLVLDGIPRNLCQADLMDPFIDVRKVFHLSCPDRNKIVARLKKRAIKDNRLDDANEEVIRQRLDTYQRESKPLLDHYGDSLIVNIDATEPPIVVLNTIVSHIADGRKNDFVAEETNFAVEN